MKNHYKILFTNHDNQKIFKLGNDLYNHKYNIIINIINHGLIKLIIIISLIIIFGLQISKGEAFNNIPIERYMESMTPNIEKPNNLNSERFWNFTFLKNEMHYYSLCNLLNIPKISLVIMNEENSKDSLFQTINQIKNLTSHNFTNIEIFLYLQNIKKKDYDVIKREFQKPIKTQILNVVEKKNNITFVDSALLNLIKGVFTIFINNFNDLKNLQIEHLFNYTKGKINNYFNLSITNSSKLYLFRTKSLKDLIDIGIEFSSFELLLNSIISLPIPNINYIHISFCPDNSFAKLAYVSMSSILTSKVGYTYICFYLIVPPDFDDKNKMFLESLYEVYDYFNISFVQMDDRYKKAYTDRRITKQAYYRFSLGELLPNLNKVIYLDTDIIAYKDLTNFYNLNFNGKMILGQPTYGNKNAEKSGFHRINTGVLLLNLIEMRKNKFEEKVIDIIKKGKKLRYHDQTLLDDYFKKYLGIFPPEYHTRPWSDYKEMEIFNKKIGKVFDQDYFYFVHKYPTIRHFLGGYKPRNPNINHIEDWWFFARKSKYYNNSAFTYDSAFSY